MNKADKTFHVTKVYSRNIITDWVQKIRNIFGLELTAYTNVIDQGVTELLRETPSQKKWFKIDVEQISTGGFLIMIYGEKK